MVEVVVVAVVVVVCREEAAGFRAVARHIDRAGGRASTAAAERG